MSSIGTAAKAAIKLSTRNSELTVTYNTNTVSLILTPPQLSHPATLQQYALKSNPHGPPSLTKLDSVTRQLVGVSGSQTDIMIHIGREDLSDDILVGDTDNVSVLRGLVLVLVLDDQTLTGVVISLSLTATSVLDLVTLVISLVLNDLWFVCAQYRRGGKLMFVYIKQIGADR